MHIRTKSTRRNERTKRNREEEEESLDHGHVAPLPPLAPGRYALYTDAGSELKVLAVPFTVPFDA